jgi:hypothetical protein
MAQKFVYPFLSYSGLKLQDVGGGPSLVRAASINQGKVPEEWKSANITPLFKKGDRSAPVNYHPASLTSVCSKVMEHKVFVPLPEL